MPSKKSWKRSRRFPFLKRTQSVIERGNSVLQSVATQLSKPLDSNPPRSKRSSKSKSTSTTTITATSALIARAIKYTVLLLLIVAVVVSASYLALYTRDYVREDQHRNPAEVVRAALLLGISIAVLVFVNSRWHALGTFSVPLSISFR